MSSTTAVIATVLVAGAMALPTHRDLDRYSFEQYNKDFAKGHAKGTPEYNRRHALFEAARLDAVRHNAGRSLYKKGVNHLSDRSPAELAAMRGNKMHLKPLLSRPAGVRKATGAQLPKYVDWRNARPQIMTSVKDQGHCGSCWAHAATETVEAHAARVTGRLFTLSHQQVTSCAPTPNQCGGTGGCQGATTEAAYNYLMTTTGQTQEWEWGYSSYFGESGKCAMPQGAKPKVQVTGYNKIAHNDAQAVLEAVALEGPLAISVDARAWPSYESGIFDGCSYASNITMDHAVQLVGYGTDEALGADYWLVRNSWSASYGEDGYIRVLRRKETECGWNVDPQQGSGCKGQTAPEWACGMCGIAFDALYPLVKLAGL